MVFFCQCPDFSVRRLARGTQTIKMNMKRVGWKCSGGDLFKASIYDSNHSLEEPARITFLKYLLTNSGLMLDVKAGQLDR
jgi:hypothetical protein